jgi:hypothetical protein
MTLQLDYGTVQTTAVPRKSLVVAVLLGIFAVLTTAGIIEHSADLASRAFLALMIPTDCGTGRHAAESELYFQMPWVLTAPLILVLLSYGFRTGVLICRCALWASVVGWATAAFFVYCRYQLC